jgi:hypothetical protein
MIKEIKNSNVLNYYCDMDVLSSKYKSMSLKDKWMYLMYLDGEGFNISIS